MLPDDLGVLLLAGGSSRRFGGDKLLAPFLGKPLGAHAASLAKRVPAKCRVAVIPPEQRERQALFEGYGLKVVQCTDSFKGQGCSLRQGIDALSVSDVRSVLILLGDMPFVRIDHVKMLFERIQGHRGSIAWRRGHPSPPGLFTLPLLRMLGSRAGPRGLGVTLQGRSDVARVRLDADALVDIDTMEELQRLETEERVLS